MKNNVRDSSGVISPPPLIYLVPLLIGLLLHWVAPVRFFPSTFQLIVGLPLIGIGIFLILWAVRVFKHTGTDISVSKPTTTIVAEGPYRFTRNPMYLSMTLTYLGIAISFNALWPLLLLPGVLLIMQFGVISREERYLEKKFGKEYLQYKGRVRPWI